MSDAGFPINEVRGLPVVEVPEEIDIGNADELRGALLESAEDGHATVVIDMTRTEFCDTAGLHVLVLAHKRALAAGGEVRLVVPTTSILRIFAITGIDRVIPHFTSLEGALAPGPAAVSQPGPPPGMHAPSDVPPDSPGAGNRPRP